MTFLLSRRLPIASAGQLHTNQGMTVGTDITIASISSYLRTHLPEIGVPIGLEKFMGGQSNPTFLLTTQSGKFVLRSKPKGNLLKSAHLVEREFHVMSNLADSGVPVPKMFHLAQDDVSPIGRAFFVMEYLQGRVFWDPTLPDLKVEERCDYYLSMSTSLADLHQIDPQQFGLGDFGKPGNYFVRQLTRWGANYRTSTKTPSRDMLGIMEWLEKTVPHDDGQIALVHGDYRLDNIMFCPQRSSVLGILDWELSTLGHPIADLAYQCMQLRLPYGSGMRGLGGIDRRSFGIPSETEYVRSYASARSIDPPADWDFYLVFSYFRLIAILQGVVSRAENGNGSNPKQAQEFGKAIPLLENQAMAILKDGADV